MAGWPSGILTLHHAPLGQWEGRPEAEQGAHRASDSAAISSFTKTASTEQALDLALEVLARLHREGIDEETLRSVKAYVRGQYPPRLETGDALAAKLTEIEASGLGRGDVDDYEARVEAATSESVKTAIQEVYPEEALLFVLVGNAGAIRGVAAKYGDLTEMSIADPSWRPEPTP